MILDLQKHKDKDFRSAYRFALISTLFLFGLRRSEVKARKFKDVDFEKAILNELQHGMKAIKANETFTGAKRFSDGAGRHGSFD